MLPTDFLRTVSAAEIKRASDDSVNAENAAGGQAMNGQESIVRMHSRLKEIYPGIAQHIDEFLRTHIEINSPEMFMIGFYAGAVSIAHDVTLAAEVHDISRQFEEPYDKQ